MLICLAFSSSPGGPSAEVDPSFQLVGSLTLNIGSLRKNKFQLVDPMSPLDGAIEMDLKCYAEETGTIGHKAFLVSADCMCINLRLLCLFPSVVGK